jgi:hypothetical protein
MEAAFLILVGAALFSQSWHILGLYSDGRMMGILVGGLGILSLGALLMLEPMLLTGSGDKTISAANHLAELTATKVLIAVWGLYCIGVAAQALWDLEERTVGFYSVIVAIATAVIFLYYAGVLEPRYGEGTWIGLAAASLLLTVVSTVVFFALGFTFNVMRAVAAWALLLCGATVGVIGLAVVVRAIA